MWRRQFLQPVFRKMRKASSNCFPWMFCRSFLWLESRKMCLSDWETSRWWSRVSCLSRDDFLEWNWKEMYDLSWWSRVQWSKLYQMPCRQTARKERIMSSLSWRQLFPLWLESVHWMPWKYILWQKYSEMHFSSKYKSFRLPLQQIPQLTKLLSMPYRNSLWYWISVHQLWRANFLEFNWKEVRDVLW